MMKLETSDLEILLDIAEVLLDLCLELAGGEQHLGRGSPVRDGAEQNLYQVRNLPRVVAGDGAVLALMARIVRKFSGVTFNKFLPCK